MGNFWTYVASFQNIQPVTTVLVLGQVGIFVYQAWRKVQPDEFAFRYEAVVEGREYWRCVTATFSHLGIFHVRRRTAQHQHTHTDALGCTSLHCTALHTTGSQPYTHSHTLTRPVTGAISVCCRFTASHRPIAPDRPIRPAADEYAQSVAAGRHGAAAAQRAVPQVHSAARPRHSAVPTSSRSAQHTAHTLSLAHSITYPPTALPTAHSFRTVRLPRHVEFVGCTR